MKRRYGIFLGLAGAHLILVGLGAAAFDLSRLGVVGDWLAYYGELSGSSAGYGFFAPGVGGQLRAYFDVVDSHGKAKKVVLDEGVSHEASLRIGDIIEQFEGSDADDDDDDDQLEDVQRSLAASLAGTVFGWHPEARKVVVHLDSYEPVSMADYRQGKRAQWEPMYQATFVHNSGQTAEEQTVGLNR